MTTLAEASTAQNAGMGASLQAGIAQLSAEEQFTFTLYKRLVLPVDGYVFWVNASQLDSGFLATYGARPFNQTAFNALPGQPLTPVEQAQLSFQINGSLHLSQSSEQTTEAFIARQTAVFTVKSEVRDFSLIAPDEMFVMTLPNGRKLSFSSQRMRYDQAGIWHYTGTALLPYEATQLVDDPSALDVTNAIVSDSMPIWLRMSTPQLPIFPATLSPFNFEPPYITVDITDTEALAGAPLLDPTSSQAQLVKESVKFTLWGTRNNSALDFQRAVLLESFQGEYGIMNMPAPVDEKQTQADFGIIAQKKTMVVDVNYYQARTRDIARRYIQQAFITVTTD